MDTERRRVDQLKVGDMVDLEGDIFADYERRNAALEFEYATVATIERETSDCIAIGFEGVDIIGFPPTHYVRVYVGG